MNRPLGVVILSLLSLVSGLWSLLKGLAWLGIGGAVAAVAMVAHPIAGALIGGLAMIFAILSLLTGLFSLVFAWGAWNLRPWAWTLGVATHTSILVWSLLVVLGPGLLSERWVTLLLSGIVLYYLTTPAIKGAFGKA